jgi:hypothetical protein
MGQIFAVQCFGIACNKIDYRTIRGDAAKSVVTASVEAAQEPTSVSENRYCNDQYWVRYGYAYQ